MTRLASCLVSLLALCALNAQAQVATTVTVAGRIIDSSTRAPVRGAVVRHLASNTAAVADSAGMFTLEVEPTGAYVIRVEQLGYEDSQAVLPSTAPIEVTTIAIRPKPLELEGLEVNVVSQFERRRISSARPVTVLDQVKIAELGGYGRETLVRAIPLTRLCYLPDGALCFLGKGGSKDRVSICIDELPAYRGVSDLDLLEPADIHSIELFNWGRHVRIYTRVFMADLLAKGKKLKPLNWCP